MSKQIGGKHYNMPIEPVEYIAKNKIDFLSGNIIKYASRHKRKNGAEDVKKIIHYALLVLKHDYGYDEFLIQQTLRHFIQR